MCVWMVPVGLDGPPKPCDRLIPATEVVFRSARVAHPNITKCITRAETQWIENVNFRFFSSPNVYLTQPNKSVALGKISIQRQRVLAFGDALRGALREYLNEPQVKMRARMVWDHGQCFDQFRFGGCKLPRGIGDKDISAGGHVCPRWPNERFNVVGVDGQGLVEKIACLRNIFLGRTLVKPRQTPKIEVHRAGGRSLFCALRLGRY
jgi:hypothetical protein